MQGRNINADLREWTGGHGGREGGMNGETSTQRVHTLEAQLSSVCDTDASAELLHGTAGSARRSVDV